MGVWADGRMGVRWALRKDGAYGTDGTNVERPMGLMGPVSLIRERRRHAAS